METDELLDRAADILRERGRCRGTLQNAKGEVCLFGALNVAHHGSASFAARSVCDVYDASLYYPEATSLLYEARWGHPCVDEVRRRSQLTHWNDSFYTNDHEVVSFMREAAKIYRQRKESHAD